MLPRSCAKLPNLMTALRGIQSMPHALLWHPGRPRALPLPVSNIRNLHFPQLRDHSTKSRHPRTDHYRDYLTKKGLSASALLDYAKSDTSLKGDEVTYHP